MCYRFTGHLCSGLTDMSVVGPLLDWIEQHHALASWVEAFGVIGSLWLTQHIASGERRARERDQAAYRGLLLAAFRSLLAPLKQLADLPITAPAHNPALAHGTSERTAEVMREAISRMQDVLNVLREVEDMRRMADFSSALALLRARKGIEDAEPAFKNELNWLEKHPESESVVNSAMNTLACRADELLPLTDAVISALGGQTTN